MYIFEFYFEPATDSGYFRRHYMKNLGKLAILGVVLAASATSAFATTITLASYGSVGLAGYTVAGVAVTNSETAMQYVGKDNGFASIALTPAAPTASQLLGQGSSVFTATGVEATELNPFDVVAVWNGPLANSAWVGINANAGPVGTTNAANDPSYGYYEFTTDFSGVSAGNYALSLETYSDDTVEVFLNDGTLLATLAPLGQFNAATTTNLASVALTAGTDELEFVVQQGGNDTGYQDPSGIDFTATLTSNPSGIPEPNSLILLGTGLLGGAGMLMRRRRLTA
jgi:hypothetical protein